MVGFTSDNFLWDGSAISHVNVYEHSSGTIVMASRAPHARMYFDLARLLLIMEFMEEECRGRATRTIATPLPPPLSLLVPDWIRNLRCFRGKVGDTWAINRPSMWNTRNWLKMVVDKESSSIFYFLLQRYIFGKKYYCLNVYLLLLPISYRKEEKLRIFDSFFFSFSL